MNTPSTSVSPATVVRHLLYTRLRRGRGGWTRWALFGIYADEQICRREAEDLPDRDVWVLSIRRPRRRCPAETGLVPECER